MQIFFIFFFYWLFCNILVLVLASHTVVQKFGIASSFQKIDKGSRAPITVSVFLHNENIFHWNNEIMLKNVHSIEGSVPEVILQKKKSKHTYFPWQDPEHVLQFQWGKSTGFMDFMCQLLVDFVDSLMCTDIIDSSIGPSIFGVVHVLGFGNSNSVFNENVWMWF